MCLFQSLSVISHSELSFSTHTLRLQCPSQSIDSFVLNIVPNKISWLLKVVFVGVVVFVVVFFNILTKISLAIQYTTKDFSFLSHTFTILSNTVLSDLYYCIGRVSV